MAQATGKTRGIFERPKGSGVWWVWYADQYGLIHREKCGAKNFAKSVYQQRKTAIREKRFFPEQVGQQRVILLDELAEDFLTYSKANNRSISFRGSPDEAAPGGLRGATC